ncbi:flagellar hook-length control protein FliK [Marinomonas communis]|uniref:flagellar hook-length control protein FliK n=1 Tax=Marinomonas communis TaxID=28254 RepID=UPI001D182F0A|nr:flagellar hook-length control protein FliK [Marinomonas communis]MCC4274607.1 flagellar hook-length control protein FliK [Marinomonas communis]
MITSSPLMSPVTASVKQSKPLAGSSNESEGSFASTFQKAVYEDQQEAKSTAASAPSEKTQSNQSSNQSESLPAEGNEQVEAVDAVADSEASFASTFQKAVYEDQQEAKSTAASTSSEKTQSNQSSNKSESLPAEGNEQMETVDAVADSEANESAPTSPQTASKNNRNESEKDLVTDDEEVSGGNVEQIDRQDLAGESLAKEQSLENVELAAELDQAENEEVQNNQDQMVVDHVRVEQSELASPADVKTQSDLGQSKSVENELNVEKVEETSSLEFTEEPDKQSLPFPGSSDEQIAAGDSGNMDTDQAEEIDASIGSSEPKNLNEEGLPLPETELTQLSAQQGEGTLLKNSILNDGKNTDALQVESEQSVDSYVVNTVLGGSIATGAKERDASAVQSVSSLNPTSRDASASGLERATENLRLMMEQMSKQGAAASTNTNATLSQSLSLDAKLESGALVQVEGELIQVDAEDGLISKNIDNLLGDKKSFEQILSNLGSVSQQGQLNSSLFSTVASTTAARNDSLAAQLTMQSMPDAQTFPNEMATKVAWVAKEGFKVAHIQLDPPELGSLAVKVSVDQDSNTHVSFVASSAQAKDALEGQMQRLRDMLQQQGLELDSVDVEVSQGNGQAFGSNNSDHASGGTQSDTGLVSDSDGLDEDLDNVTYVAPAEQGIDYYA